MTLYYTLNTDQYKGNPEEIGELMDKFANSLYESTGLSLGIYCGPTEEELQAYSNHQGIQVLTEEVLWKNLTEEGKAKKILEYINQISDDENRTELIIIDPYLLKKPKAGEYDVLTNILQSCGYAKIIAVVGKEKVDEDYKKSISDLLGDRLTIKYTDEIHDRFWISNREKGFLTGTSMNGIGKKYCVIQNIELDDVKTIVHILESELKVLP